MKMPRTILVIEDKARQFTPIRDDLTSGGWVVVRAEDEATAWRELELAETTGRVFDAILLDLGLPPEMDNPFRVGIPLAKRLRQRFPLVPMMAYSSIVPSGGLVDYDRLLAALLPLRVSFIYQRKLPDDVTFAGLFDLILRGFHLLGPGVAEFLTDAVADSPDPLPEKEYWDTLAQLGKERSDAQIAAELSLSEAGVRNRINNIYDRLMELDLLPATERLDRRALVEWYFANRVRYHRP